MEWFTGNISDAVAKAKNTNACLVVFIEDGGESSKRLDGLFTHEIVYKALNVPKFVCLRFTQDSEAYMHFSSIYRLVPVPSIFFIRQNGTPIAVATSLLQLPEELYKKITEVINILSQDTSIPTTTTNSDMASTSTATAARTDCPGGVCPLPQIPKTNVVKPKKVAHDDLSEERRQREHNFKETQEQIRREKLLEQQARKLVLAQIAADRHENWQARNSTPISSSPVVSSPDESSVLHNNAMSDNVRLQFRLANGEASVHVFQPNDTFSIVREHVRTKVLGVGHNKFNLATIYPKVELGMEFDDKTLLELGLCPSAVVLVIILAQTMQNSSLRVRFDSVATVLGNVFMAILNPVLNFFNYLRHATFGRASAQHKKDDDNHGSNLDASMRRREARDNPDSANNATARRWAGGANVHRLRDQTQNDEDDNATWNGNSTQQQ